MLSPLYSQQGTGWKGKASTNAWSNSGGNGLNWTNGIPGDYNNNTTFIRDLYFGRGYIRAGGNGFTTANNDITSWAGYRITFEDSNSNGSGGDSAATYDTAFTITGKGFTLFAFGTNNYPRIENDSYLTQTFTLTSGQTIVFDDTSSGSTHAEINPVNASMVFSAGPHLRPCGLHTAENLRE